MNQSTARRFTARTSLGACLALGTHASTASAQVGTAFVGGTVITMGDRGVLRDHTVLVRGDTIIAVGPTAAITVPANFRVISATGKFVLPGLTDSHVHLWGRGDLSANLRYGVTTVLQMSGQRGAISDFLALRREIESGTLAGPRVFLTGPMFERIGLAQQGTAYAMQSADTLPTLLAQHRAARYDFIKVHNQTSPATYRALLKAGLPVVGHIPIGISLDEALRSGQVMLAHSELIYYNLFGFPAFQGCADGFWRCVARARADTSVLDRVAAQVRASGLAVTADLAILAAEERVYADYAGILADPEFSRFDPALQANWRADGPDQRAFVAERRQDLANRVPFTYALVKRLNALGVPILAGTDAPLPGVFPGKALHLELRELVRAGLTPMDALRAATSTPGDFFRKHVPSARPAGRVERGYVADLLLLDRNPLQDISATERIAGTMSRGVWYPVDVRAVPPRDTR